MTSHPGPAVSVIASCFKGERYLAPFLESAAQQSIRNRIEVILIHNAPTAAELAIVGAFCRKYPALVRHLVVDHVEPVSASMNRGVGAAASEYLAIWNVDDRRTHDSLERQLAVLERDPALVATYGDCIVVPTYGATSGRLLSLAPFDPETFTLGYHGGCFPMWRRSVMEASGYFDEQLLVVADFDLFVRLAFNGPMRKTEGLLGYYLDAGQGLSTRADTLLYREGTLVQLRYGMYGNIDYRFYLGSRRYRRDEVLFDGRAHPVELFVPNYRAIIGRRKKTLMRGFVNFLTLMLRAAIRKLWRARARVAWR